MATFSELDKAKDLVKSKLGVDEAKATSIAGALLARDEPVRSENWDDVQRIGRERGFGEGDQAVLQSLYGINHRGNIQAVPANRLNYGLTFFTRPRLNLSYDNIAIVRTFVPMLTRDELTVMRAIRAYLDPVGARLGGGLGYPCKLINDRSPFIGVLSNNILNISGWPDPFVDTFTSKPGVYKEEWVIVDGFARIFNSFEITANFRNIVGDPISKMFYLWTQYAAYVHEGIFDPYMEAILENEIDYDTRIYRLVLNAERNHVEEICATGAAFPLTSNIGSHFDFDSDKPHNESVNQISATFKCMGVDYNDPILVYEFNETVRIFEPQMHDSIRTSFFTKMSPALADLFNGRGLPRIDPDTMELQWWIRNSEYNALMATLPKEE